MLLPLLYNSLEPSRTRVPPLSAHWSLLPKLFPRSSRPCSMRNVLLVTLPSGLPLDCFKLLDWLYIPSYTPRVCVLRVFERLADGVFF